MKSRLAEILKPKKYNNPARPKYKYRVFLPQTDKEKSRPYKVFKTIKEAEEFVSNNRPKSPSTDILSACLPESKRREYIDAESLLNGSHIDKSVADAVKEYVSFCDEIRDYYGLNFQDAVSFFRSHYTAKRKARNKNMRDAIEEYLSCLKIENKTIEHIKNVRQHLERLKSLFDFDLPMFELIAQTPTNKYIDFLYSMQNKKSPNKSRSLVSAKTMQNYYITYRAFFCWCKNRDYIEKNPFEKTIAKPKNKETEPEIYTPKQIKDLLECAKTQRLDIRLFILLSAFAGLRHAEIKRLSCASIDLQNKNIVLDGSITKTAQRRVVKIMPCLHKALMRYKNELNSEQIKNVLQRGFE